MLKKIIKKCTEFLVFLVLIAIVFIGLNKSIYKDGNLDYYKQIGKAEKQIKYSQFTDFGVSALQYAPVVIGFLSHNPMMYTNYVLSMTLAVPICQGLKYIVKETRPDDINNNKSFPSGHATLAFVGVSVLIMSIKKYKSRLFIGWCSIILAILVAYGRVLAKRHWYIDVIVGGILGCSSGCISYYILSKIDKKFHFFNEERKIDKQDI